MIKTLAAVLAAGLCLAGAATAQRIDPADLLRRHAEAGTLAAGEAALAALPQDRQAIAALGMIKFGRAVETLAQGLHRHGLKSPRHDNIPLLRLPVPENPQPAPLTYDALRAIYARFLADLAAAEAVLARLPEGSVRLPLDLNAVRLDLDGDGQASPAEALGRIVARVGGADPRLSEPAADMPVEPWEVGFDRADMTWLRGYCHLLSAMLEFVLAHDWRDTYAGAAHLFFAGASDPSEARAAPERPRDPILGGDGGQFADLVALVHLVRWPLAEPERLPRAREHLKSMIALSRQSWTEIQAETDDDHEWLPGPNQRNTAFPGLEVTADRLDAWKAALAEFEAALDGTLLVPHWRYRQGFDLKAVFTEPRPFDLVMWGTGHAALPYLKDGPQMSRTSWNQWQRIFAGQFLTYALWFN
ncbi:hypothetical protein [Phreatobacter sp. AB_2022a]|uniref:hypothetical protein n=1 Tax=Phreatobacter sp. AB_2022a TaxID=3003134 RepID=UPI002286D827|nr:hypothetical protein [Phreatobacter sp. AB_2022a]MCZ0735754.1 hypothetical protein [Phreatobacter sp. AB_2022a]